MDSSTDNETLYAACADEGSDRQREAYVVLWGLLYHVAYRMVDDQRDAQEFAADCAQMALVKVYTNLGRCETPALFRRWAAQITRRVVIDELRVAARLPTAPLIESAAGAQPADEVEAAIDQPHLRRTLHAAIVSAPLSDRSRRVILGRYFEQRSDEALAEIEGQLSGLPVAPSQLQVTRSKNFAKLRADAQLVARLRDLVQG